MKTFYGSDFETGVWMFGIGIAIGIIVVAAGVLIGRWLYKRHMSQGHSKSDLFGY